MICEASTVKVVGKPYEGEPHVRFDVAGGGNQDLGARRHSSTLPGRRRFAARLSGKGGSTYASTPLSCFPIPPRS